MNMLLNTVLVLFVATSAFASGEKKLTVESGTVEFLANTNAFIKVRGEGAVPTGTMTIANGKASGEFKLDVSAFKTGMDRRDQHMKDALETSIEANRFATVTFKDVDIKEGTTKTAIPAELELHGVKKPVTLDAELKEEKATGTFKVKLSEHGIKAPTFSGMTVKDEIEITIDSVLK